MTKRHGIITTWVAFGTLVAAHGCGAETAGLARAAPAAVTVEFDFDERPLPEIPLPNDIATRPDPSSATGLRVNASLLAPTGMERAGTRACSTASTAGACRCRSRSRSPGRSTFSR